MHLILSLLRLPCSRIAGLGTYVHSAVSFPQPQAAVGNRRSFLCQNFLNALHLLHHHPHHQLPCLQKVSQSASACTFSTNKPALTSAALDLTAYERSRSTRPTPHAAMLERVWQIWWVGWIG